MSKHTILELFSFSHILKREDQKVHLTFIIQDRNQVPIPIRDPPFGMVGKGKGFCNGLIGNFRCNYSLEYPLVFFMGIEFEMVMAGEVGHVTLACFGVRCVDPDKIKISIEKYQRSYGVVEKCLQYP